MYHTIANITKIFLSILLLTPILSQLLGGQHTEILEKPVIIQKYSCTGIVENYAGIKTRLPSSTNNLFMAETGKLSKFIPEKVKSIQN